MSVRILIPTINCNYFMTCRLFHRLTFGFVYFKFSLSSIPHWHQVAGAVGHVPRVIELEALTFTTGCWIFLEASATLLLSPKQSLKSGQRMLCLKNVHLQGAVQTTGYGCARFCSSLVRFQESVGESGNLLPLLLVFFTSPKLAKTQCHFPSMWCVLCFHHYFPHQPEVGNIPIVDLEWN